MAEKTIILGSQGMLGQELKALLERESGYEVLGWDKDDIDVTDFPALRERLAAEKPDLVINAAAYNAVDLCEESDEEYQKALLLNRDVPDALAKLSNELDFLLVHYSTDYVFDGTIEDKKEGGGCGNSSCCGGNCHGGGERGYGEGAFPNPLSRYGESKAAGEERVVSQAKRYYLIRLSKLFGKPAVSPGGKRSFFEMMLEAGKAEQEVQAVDSEKSKFTYAPDLALATKDLIESGEPAGIYHLANEGAVTWYEAVQELYRQAGLSAKITPVTPEAFPRKALRPRFSALINTKRPPLRRYEVALAEYLSELH